MTVSSYNIKGSLFLTCIACIVYVQYEMISLICGGMLEETNGVVAEWPTEIYERKSRT